MSYRLKIMPNDTRILFCDPDPKVRRTVVNLKTVELIVDEPLYLI
jgi:hypothetical protein